MANNSTFVTSKKQSLLDYKSKLLYDIKNCEREIDEAQRLYNRNLQFTENGISKFDSDSDSDDAIYQKLVKTAETKNKGIDKDVLDNMQTCLQATEELTDLQILHSDIRVMVQPPQLTEQYKHEEVEDGVWREVYADCKAGFVPFSIAFYVHQPYRKHSPPSYHNVQVGIVKKNHEIELEQSILKEVQRPSDAVQIMRNYAVAHRCRRATLAQLAEKYGNGDLDIEIMSDGGYLLKCSDVFDLSWRLENKWSPVTRFYHQLKMNVDSMDEHNIETIRDAFTQLRKQNLKADERAFLLSEILDICIQFRNESDGCNDIDDIVRSKSSSNQKYTSGDNGRKRKKKHGEDTAGEEYVTKKAKPSEEREITELVERRSKAYFDERPVIAERKSDKVISGNSQMVNPKHKQKKQDKTNNTEKNRPIDDIGQNLNKEATNKTKQNTQMIHTKNAESEHNQKKQDKTNNTDKNRPVNYKEQNLNKEPTNKTKQNTQMIHTKNAESEHNQKKQDKTNNTDKNEPVNHKEQNLNKEPINKTKQNTQMIHTKNAESEHNQKKQDKTNNTDKNKPEKEFTNKIQHGPNVDKSEENTLKEKQAQGKLTKNKHSNNVNVKNANSNHNTKVSNLIKNKQIAVAKDKDKQSKVAKTNKVFGDNKENNVRTKIPQKITLHKKVHQNPLRSSPRKSPRNIAGSMLLKKSIFAVKGKSVMAVKASNKLIKK